MEKKLNDIKRYLRDIKFSIIFGEGQITLKNDLEEFNGKVPFFFGKSAQKLHLIDKYMTNTGNQYDRDAHREAEKHVNDLFMIVTTIAANESKTA